METQLIIEQLTKENTKLKKALAFYEDLCPDVFACKTCDELVSADDDRGTYVCERCNQPFHAACDPVITVCAKHQLNKERNCEHLTPCPDCPPGNVHFYSRCKSHFNPDPKDEVPNYCWDHILERLNGTRGTIVPMELSNCCTRLDWQLCKSCFDNPEPVVKMATILPSLQVLQV